MLRLQVSWTVAWHGLVIIVGLLQQLADRMSDHPPQFTHKQGQYLAYIYFYTRIHGRAPSEYDLQQHFQVSPPTVHQMIIRLANNGLISRTAGAPRSIRVLVAAEDLPNLD